MNKLFENQAIVANLDDLREQLINRIAIAMIVISGIGIMVALGQAILPLRAFLLLSAIFGLGIFSCKLVQVHAILTRRSVVFGLLACLLAAMGIYPDLQVPFLGLLLVFIGAFLVEGGEFITFAMVSGLSIWLTRMGVRAYPLEYLLLFLALAVVFSRLVIDTLYTALEWAWNSQMRANELLKQTRSQRDELKETLKNLETAYSFQRRLQKELITARKEAERARLLKERFAANISHELRTPLNLILGFADVMCFTPEVYGDFQWPSKLRGDIHQIYRNSKHLLSMIGDILDLSRYDIAGFRLTTELTRVEDLIENTTEIASELFHKKAVRLEVKIEPGLPMIAVDRTRIRQVLINLLNNSCQHTEQGFVRMEVCKGKSEIIFSVVDSGSGIPAEKLPFIFDEYYQGDLSIRRKHQGSGLGLAICKRFVEAHDGRIWAESDEGSGACFHFSLPVSRQAVWNPPTRI